MRSLKLKAENYPRLVIDVEKEPFVVIEIHLNGMKISEKIIAVDSLRWNPATGKSNIVLSFNELS